MIKKLASILKLDRRAGRTKRARLHLDMTDLAVYAIGDVHGCHDELLTLERKIVADAVDVEAR